MLFMSQIPMIIICLFGAKVSSDQSHKQLCPNFYTDNQMRNLTWNTIQ
jgi:hypothetical protein